MTEWGKKYRRYFRTSNLALSAQWVQGYNGISLTHAIEKLVSDGKWLTPRVADSGAVRSFDRPSSVPDA